MLYVVCRECDSAFDDLHPAYQHQLSVQVGDQEDSSIEDIELYESHTEPVSWVIRTESEVE